MPNQIESREYHSRCWYLKTLLLLISCCVIQMARPQSHKINFVHHTVENGLSQSSVLSIAQDSLGFMWFGTKDGLNKFNTQTFEIYRHKRDDNSSLSSSQNINALLTDHKGNLWVGTQNGLNLYLRNTNSFQHFLIPQAARAQLSSNVIRSLFEDRQGVLWVGTDEGLYTLKGGRFQRIEGRSADGKIFRKQLIKSIYQDHEGSIWIAAMEGLTRIRVRNNSFEFRSFTHDPRNTESLIGNDITAVIEDRRHRLWIGTHEYGLVQFDRLKEVFKRVRPVNSGIANKGDVIRTLALDKDGKIWIGMLHGIQLFDPEKNEFTLLTHDAEIATSLNQNSVYDIHRDAAGSMWIGTYYGGINVYHVDAMPFKEYKSFADRNSLSSNVVSAVVEDRHHNLWIGTEAEGLNYYNRRSGIFKSFKTHKGLSDLSSNLIKAIEIDNKDRVWVGTYEGGLDLYLPGKNTFKHYSENAPGLGRLSSKRITCLLFDRQSRLWAGTRADGIYLYDEKNDVFFSCDTMLSAGGKPIRHIRHLYEDRRGNVWAATNRGTYILRQQANQFQQVIHKERNILLDDVNVIAEDHLGMLWLGSYEGGLMSYEPAREIWKNYRLDDGLPSNVILGILEDAAGSLWLSTDNGLSKFDGKIFKNYTIKDGLPGNVFNYNSFLKDHHGELFFGGYNGLLSFFPSQIKDNTASPKAVFTNLRLFNQPVQIGDKTGLLNNNINVIKELSFSHDQNIFSIDFAVLNYIKPEKNRYAFKLEGFERDWNYVSAPSATFTNLPSGSYTLLIRGTNNDGVWSRVEKLIIQVRPPYWATWWAYSLYVISILGLIFLIFRFLWMRAMMKREQEVHNMKLDFFTNVSHEIRTPLTLITGPLEMLIADSQEFPVLHRKLLALRKNAGRLNRLVTELMDFRKTEAGKMTLHVSPENLVTFCREIFLSFRYLAIKHEIDYRFECDERPLEVFFDKFQLEKVIFNLLSNAFKFTPDHGIISLAIIRMEDGLTKVIVSDSGVGIAEENRRQIFTNFYQVKDPATRHNGSGLGLALSKKIAKFHHGDLALLPQDKGAMLHTSFCLSLKPGSGHFRAEELKTPYFNTDDPALYQEFVVTEPQIENQLSSPKPEAAEILIVEDNVEVREFIRNSLHHQYHVAEAANGRMGLQMALESIPDLIVSDVMMPEMDGLELCRLLKIDERTSHVPVVLLTARSGHIHELSGLKTGADVYLTKPFGMTSLQLTIANLLTLQSNLRKKFSRQLTLQPENILIESSGAEFLQKLMTLIEMNLVNENFSVNTLASDIGMSTPVLYKKIKALTGMTVNNFIKSVRLKRAAQILKQNNSTVYEVAYMVGFNDSKYFSREFSRQFGLSPSEYVLMD